MTDYVHLNRDRTAVVPEGTGGKTWRISRKEAVRLGLLSDENAPKQARRTSAPEDISEPMTTTSVRQDKSRTRTTSK